MTNSKIKLTEDQLKIIETYRTTSQKMLLDLITDLGKSGLENPSLSVLSEISGLTGDVIYLIEKYATPETLLANQCKNIEEFTELLCTYANSCMINVIKDYRFLVKVTEGILHSEMEEAKKATLQ